MKDLIIIGAGGFGREIAWVVERINAVSEVWRLIGFIDDNESIQGKSINGYTVLGKVDEVRNYADTYFACAIGNSVVREKIVNRIKSINPEAKFAILIDPMVQMSDLVTVGEGTIICAPSIITVNITIGEHVIMNMDCTVGHDAVLEDYSTFYPSVNVSGMTKIGRCTEVGTGSQIIQGKKIGNYSIVGAGSVVVKDLPDNCTAVGIPAVPIKFREN